MRAAGGVQGKECASSRPSWVASPMPTNGPPAVPWNLTDGQGARWVKGRHSTGTKNVHRHEDRNELIEGRQVRLP